MTTTSNATLVLGRGEVYFDRFSPGTMQGEGELYLGNTPGFTVSRSQDETPRLRSYGGQLVQTDSVITREKASAQIKTDNVSMENLALWFGGDLDMTGQQVGATTTETFVVKQGLWYQLGRSYHPVGVRHVEETLSLKKGAVVLNKTTNFQIDWEEGRFRVLPDAPDVDSGDTVTANFIWRSSFYDRISTKPVEVVGALRYIAKNPHGPQISYYFPCVTLKPRNELDLKADAFMNFAFDVEARKRGPGVDLVYLTKHAEAYYTSDEIDLINSGLISIEEFPGFEDEFHQVMNFNTPLALASPDVPPYILTITDGGEEFLLVVTADDAQDYILVGGS